MVHSTTRGPNPLSPYVDSPLGSSVRRRRITHVSRYVVPAANRPRSNSSKRSGRVATPPRRSSLSSASVAAQPGRERRVRGPPNARVRCGRRVTRPRTRRHPALDSTTIRFHPRGNHGPTIPPESQPSRARIDGRAQRSGTDLSERAQRGVRIVHATASGIGPLIGILVPLSPFAFEGSIPSILKAGVLGVTLAVCVLAAFGVYMASISGKRWYVSAVHMPLPDSLSRRYYPPFRLDQFRIQSSLGVGLNRRRP